MTQHLISGPDLGIGSWFFNAGNNEHLIFAAKPANNRKEITGRFQICVQK